MIRELSRDEDVLTIEATPIKRFANAALGAITRSSVNHPVTRFKPVQDSLDRISARYRQPKSDLWDVVPVAQFDVRNRDVALVTRHDDLSFVAVPAWPRERRRAPPTTPPFSTGRRS